MQMLAAAVGLIAATLPAGAASDAGAPSSVFLSQVSQHVAANVTALYARGAGAPHDYNDETDIPGMPFSVEFLFAAAFVLLIASVPGILVALLGGGNLTKAHKVESGCLLVWLCGALYLFTNVLKFNSSHWTGVRPLTLVEAVYLLSQILTTVGYGDITPAYPRGQVWVAINVILALCLYGSLIMEVASLIGDRVAAALAARAAAANAGTDSELESQEARTLKEWDAPMPPVDKMPLVKCTIAFAFFATAGVLFWHYFPGEEKTWLQAVYMSIITLSTVGFGWFNATTEGGKVFGAFWMLLGVASLAGVITSFVELMMQIKANERRDEAGEKLEFYRLVKLCTRPVASLGDNGMDSYDFLKFGVLLQGIATQEEVEAIEARYAELADPSGNVNCAKLAELDGPPTSLLATPRNSS